MQQTFILLILRAPFLNNTTGYQQEEDAREKSSCVMGFTPRRLLAAHDKYAGFFEYGDAQSFRKGIERL
ncbi:MAG: hypothetical protein HGA78_05640 [Nitrospirales bacterium]|nr:hypothetical protein [Nitrospirales bacterium]